MRGQAKDRGMDRVALQVKMKPSRHPLKNMQQSHLTITQRIHTLDWRYHLHVTAVHLLILLPDPSTLVLVGSLSKPPQRGGHFERHPNKNIGDVADLADRNLNLTPTSVLLAGAVCVRTSLHRRASGPACLSGIGILASNDYGRCHGHSSTWGSLPMASCY